VNVGAKREGRDREGAGLVRDKVPFKQAVDQSGLSCPVFPCPTSLVMFRQ